LIALLGTGALVAVWHIPKWLLWDGEQAENWLVAAQLAGPAIASIMCGLAAFRSAGRDRQAWALMAAGSLLYIFGNAAYVIVARTGEAAPFPSWADIPFFLMALSFGGAILLYGGRTAFPFVLTTYNFTLLYGAMIFGAFFLLRHEISASRLD